MTTTMSRNPIPFLFVIAVIVVGLLMLAMTLSPHAIERHGSDAVRVRECLDDQGAVQVWLNPATGRSAHICILDVGRYGVQIQNQAGGEITSFIKEKLVRMDQVLKYLANQGYTQWIQ